MISSPRWLRRAAAGARVVGKLACFGRPRRLILFGPVSLGDDLLCTTIFREGRKRGETALWMMTRHPELFAGNPDVDRVVPLDDHHAVFLRRLGVAVTQPYYTAFALADQPTPRLPATHLIAQMCTLAGLHGPIELRPYLHLTAAERQRGQLSPRQVVIHSSGRSANAPIPNKEWFPERFQAVVTALRGRFDFIQLGAVSDPPLIGARDLRGRTTLRESAALVAASRAVVCQEGFLMHLARAVEVRAVVIYGGAPHPAISGYSANENLFRSLPCAPCWQTHRCDYSRRCMTEITATDVVAALLRVDALHSQPLPVDVAHLG